MMQIISKSDWMQDKESLNFSDSIKQWKTTEMFDQQREDIW